MQYTRRSLLGMTATTMLLAGCIGDDDEPTPEDTPSPTPTPTPDDPGDTPTPEPTTTVEIYQHAELGEILVDDDGMTLYQFDADTQGAQASVCYDDCAQNWPPLTTDGSEPEAGEDVTAPLTTFERDDGTIQIAADGWPLYYWIGDQEPGDATGQGVEDVWWVLRPDGTVVRDTDDDDDDNDDDDNGNGNGDPAPPY